jgi:hypothetical protein
MTVMKQWETTSERFVAFFDILGFKDLVLRNTHLQVLEKLDILKQTISKLENVKELKPFKNSNMETDQTKSVTFSDSIIIFSKGQTANDALKIFYDSYRILKTALENDIAIKGSISFGQITVDFSKSLFFGQPIIDAYLLHEELQMLTIVLDNKAEEQVKTYDNYATIQDILVIYKANLKSGKINHTIIRPSGSKNVIERIEKLKNLYKSTSGRPRLYIDNTIDFLNSLPQEKS